MKHIAFIAIIAAGISLSSCGGKGEKKSEKQTKLEALKKELSGLETKTIKLKDEIVLLEKELGTGSITGNGKVVEIEDVKPGNFSSYIVLEGVADAD